MAGGGRLARRFLPASTPCEPSVTDRQKQYLRLYRERSSDVATALDAAPVCLPDLLRAFRRATGWTLEYVPDDGPIEPSDLKWSAPVNPGVGGTPGHFRMEPARDRAIRTTDRLKAPAARELASAVASAMAELVAAQGALRQREAELSVAVPVVAGPAEQEQFAARLESVLKGGSRAVDCQASALYLLDEGTSELKLRAAWGLPRQRFADPARELETALADLEAMLGHAVVLEDTHLLRRWNPPESFPAAVCVPVATATSILGTLWFFSSESRDFDDRQTNLMEIVAGRVAAELERQALLHEAAETASIRRQFGAWERFHLELAPAIMPILDGWELTVNARSDLGQEGRFFDWVAIPDGRIAMIVGSVAENGLVGAALADRIRTAFRSHAQYHAEPADVLKAVNLTFQQQSLADQALAAALVVVTPERSAIHIASIGSASAVITGSAGTSLVIGMTAAGRLTAEGGDPLTYSHQTHLVPGQTLTLSAGASFDSPHRSMPMTALLRRQNT